MHQSPPHCSASSKIPESGKLLQVHGTKILSPWHKISSQYGGNELSYYLWARAVRNIPWKHTFHFLQIRDQMSVKPAVCVKTSMLKGLSLPLILCNLSICSPALTLRMVLLGACGFQVLELPTGLCQIFPTATLQKSNLWISQK